MLSEWATRRRRDEKLGHTGSAQTSLINAVIEKAVPALITARQALDRFHAMMRSKDKARLDPWIAMAAKSKLAAFAAGVETDRDAVAAAISTPWSSGQVEGKVNRLKAIKRQMYGRAKIDLLKARVMHPHDPNCTESDSDPLLHAGPQFPGLGSCWSFRTGLVAGWANKFFAFCRIRSAKRLHGSDQQAGSLFKAQRDCCGIAACH
ncbi:hypothetical protein GCM10019060_34260 [Novosphingobium pokkalii]|nr:hypothetical protein GCM10019060_34260 [Novosphingobium pokkalii]